MRAISRNRPPQTGQAKTLMSNALRMSWRHLQPRRGAHEAAEASPGASRHAVPSALGPTAMAEVVRYPTTAWRHRAFAASTPW